MQLSIGIDINSSGIRLAAFDENGGAPVLFSMPSRDLAGLYEPLLYGTANDGTFLFFSDLSMTEPKQVLSVVSVYALLKDIPANSAEIADALSALLDALFVHPSITRQIGGLQRGCDAVRIALCLPTQWTSCCPTLGDALCNRGILCKAHLVADGHVLPLTCMLLPFERALDAFLCPSAPTAVFSFSRDEATACLFSADGALLYHSVSDTLGTARLIEPILHCREAALKRMRRWHKNRTMLRKYPYLSEVFRVQAELLIPKVYAATPTKVLFPSYLAKLPCCILIRDEVNEALYQSTPKNAAASYARSLDQFLDSVRKTCASHPVTRVFACGMERTPAILTELLTTAFAAAEIAEESSLCVQGLCLAARRQEQQSAFFHAMQTALSAYLPRCTEDGLLRFSAAFSKRAADNLLLDLIYPALSTWKATPTATLQQSMQGCLQTFLAERFTKHIVQHPTVAAALDPLYEAIVSDVCHALELPIPTKTPEDVRLILTDAFCAALPNVLTVSMPQMLTTIFTDIACALINTLSGMPIVGWAALGSAIDLKNTLLSGRTTSERRRYTAAQLLEAPLSPTVKRLISNKALYHALESSAQDATIALRKSVTSQNVVGAVTAAMRKMLTMQLCHATIHPNNMQNELSLPDNKEVS